MLSSVLRSETAILVSIRIMDVFVAMRKALASFFPILMRLDTVERRQIIIDKTTLIHAGASLNHLGKKCFRRR